MTTVPRIAVIGMGEAGTTIVSGWENRTNITAYDIKTDDAVTRAAMQAIYKNLGVTGADTSAEAVAKADIVLCTVTADQAVVAAKAAAPHLSPNALWCDLNSCAPSSKTEAAAIIEAAGGRYVDVAVMSAVHPKRNMVPLLIAGPHADAAAERLADLPMAPRIVAGPIGAASSIKMIRSVMVKGLEALTAECVLAATRAGVADEVLASLAASHPGTDWEARAAYNFERSMTHGRRRAAEMAEVARTLSDLGLPNDMAEATTRWQARIAASGVGAPEDPAATGAVGMASLLLPALRDD